MYHEWDYVDGSTNHRTNACCGKPWQAQLTGEATTFRERKIRIYFGHVSLLTSRARADALPAFASSSDQMLDWLAISAGVDGIFTDQPDVVVGWRNERMTQIKNGNPFRLLNDRPKSD